jgi:hypothetical protein
MTMTGKAALLFFKRRRSSSPTMPGIRTSVIMQPGSAAAMLARNASADA